MKRAGIALDVRGVMMGHSVKAILERAVYGDEMPLPEKLKLAMKVVLDVPDHLK